MINFPKEVSTIIDELMTKFTGEPLNSRVVIYKINEEVKTASGLILPAKMNGEKKEKLPTEMGVVIAADPNNEAKVKKGDLVRYDPAFASNFLFDNRELLTVHSLQLFDRHGHYTPGVKTAKPKKTK